VMAELYREVGLKFNWGVSDCKGRLN